ncbi:hypothetical protein U1Q18_016066 [Sarracenia purpurea var. burkii]
MEGMNGNDKEEIFSDESKNERQRRLNVVDRVSLSVGNCEMSWVGSDGEDELLRPTTSISKRFRLPGKFFKDCNRVDQSSVPRKLRSAMKKRNHESNSPPLPDKKKQNHGITEVKIPRKDSRKKSKSNRQRDSEASPRSQTIEGPITKDEEEVVETLNALAEMFPFPNTNKNTALDCKLTNAKSSQMPEVEISRPEFEASGKEKDPNSPFPSPTAESTSPSLSEALSPLSKKSKPDGVKPSCSCINCTTQSILSVGTESEHEEGVACEGKPDTDNLGMVASATRPGSLDSGFLIDKDCVVPVSRGKSLKRCSAHVYISRLIKVLQIAGTEDRLPVQPTRLTPNEGSKQGGLLGANSLNSVQHALNASLSPYGLVNYAADKNQKSDEASNAIVLHNKLLQDQQQSFDFLSLSATHSSADQVKNLVESQRQFQIPYLQSVAKNQTVLPFFPPQIRFSSIPFPDNLPAAAAKQVQKPIPPPPSPPGTPLFSSSQWNYLISPKQEQWIWTTQTAAAQYNPTGVAATPHLPNWLNGRQDPSAIQMQHPQFIFQPSSLSSLEVLGPNYSPILQQQQLIAAAVASSSPAATTNRTTPSLPASPCNRHY